MAGNYIDRNPEQMIRYSENARTLIDEMQLIVRKVESLLSAYSKDLDSPTLKQIEQLNICCKSFYSQFDVYRKTADEIKKKGEKLRDIRAEG